MDRFRKNDIFSDASESGQNYRFKISKRLLGRIDQENPSDPLLIQFHPDPREWNDPLFDNSDPLTEEIHSPVPGLIHRYPDRLLVLTTDRCAVYCRFCTRKRKTIEPGSDYTASPKSVADYIQKHTEIKEVILSGGDPMILGDRQIDEFLIAAKESPHIFSVRIHTRILSANPGRITDSLCEILERNYPLTIVSHFNHPRELDDDVSIAVRKLRKAGVSMLNQSVLLKNINDNTETMAELLLQLLKTGIKPYYLHQCDEVRGVSHFRTPTSTGIKIIRELRGKIPGIAIPTYVADLPGGGGKIPLEGTYRTDERERESYYGTGGEIYTLHNS